MILEIMQHHYLSQSIPDLNHRIEKFLQLAQNNDPDALKILRKSNVETNEVAQGLNNLREAELALAGTSGDEAAFFAQDPRISQAQSVLQRYFITNGLIQKNDVAGATAVTSPVSDVRLAESVVTQAPKRLFGRMSQTDVGWIACWSAIGFRTFSGRRAFPQTSAAPRIIADDARAFLIGDWGSGVRRAKKIADRIRVMMQDQPDRDQHVIHLGDVYYSGWPEEYDDHFLAYWPVKPGEEQKYSSWCLNGNHDMYSGGFGFFDHLLKDRRFKDQQQSSYFSLLTNHWQLLGLDTAWTDEDLAGGQAEWVTERQAAHPDKKLVLMTHHQPISAFGSDCPALSRLRKQNKVTAWFWGHEHRLALYAPLPDLPYGRLVGHGGVPVWAKGTSNSPMLEYVSTGGFRSGLEKFALFGFAVMDFKDDHIDVRYFDEHGELERSETIR
ncbi:metallophosphoesterase family protein [Bradyrhizobium japonicum]|uniref:metallophosphoesterase family protein n=1 Tax=Bradyrhizobium japonicum TaxID=375 RepID=UPI0020A07316|nr:metallophosphoesterase [Bradyrhizobium japonicum]MCP1783882.1 putative membrane protein [Bradyrhizobium japonicum]MCP1963830.1 putative membrane protein [Bradyrhizobium japonicum]